MSECCQSGMHFYCGLQTGEALSPESFSGPIILPLGETDEQADTQVRGMGL